METEPQITQVAIQKSTYETIHIIQKLYLHISFVTLQNLVSQKHILSLIKL